MAASEMTLRHRPAVLLIDVRLGSGINGVEAAQRICQDRPCRVIFPDRVERNRDPPSDQRHGSGRVLVKPILPQHLIGALRSLPDP